jgi:hypothetical protein
MQKNIAGNANRDNRRPVTIDEFSNLLIVEFDLETRVYYKCMVSRKTQNYIGEQNF